MEENEYYDLDEVFGVRFLISKQADKREINSNIRAAYAILSSFPVSTVVINAHSTQKGIKNPEYTINGIPGDRKGVMSEKGITAGFKSAKRQGCKVIVIDLDEHIGAVRSFELSKYISRRKADFVNGIISACYVVFKGKAVLVSPASQSREEIAQILEKLKPQVSAAS